MSLFDRALAARTTADMQKVMKEANYAIGKHAPVEQEAYLVYGYADGWLTARNEYMRERHDHMMGFHPDYRQQWQERLREIRKSREAR